MWVIIPTFQRTDLLERTLVSLAQVHIPDCVDTIIIAENGSKAGAESMFRRYRSQLPLQYRFTNKPNKSHALNQILSETKNEFIVFFDDDVRLHSDVLVAYANAVKKNSKDAFFAGRCLVDYEIEPPVWLKQYLPWSATGWDLGNEKLLMSDPDGLGANWGAFAADLKDAGGFDEHRGPGTMARGQESAMQRKLMESGIAGYYLPDATIWHFVPKSRCCPEWCLNRAFQTSVRNGMDMSDIVGFHHTRRLFSWRVRAWAIWTLLAFAGGRMHEETRFRYQHRLQVYRGVLHGLTTRLGVTG